MEKIWGLKTMTMKKHESQQLAKYRRLSLSVFPYLGNSYSILSFFGGSWPVSRILTSAVELGSKSPESVKKKSRASKKQERVGSFIIHILDLVSL